MSLHRLDILSHERILPELAHAARGLYGWFGLQMGR